MEERIDIGCKQLREISSLVLKIELKMPWWLYCGACLTFKGYPVWNFTWAYHWNQVKYSRLMIRWCDLVKSLEYKLVANHSSLYCGSKPVGFWFRRTNRINDFESESDTEKFLAQSIGPLARGLTRDWERWRIRGYLNFTFHFPAAQFLLEFKQDVQVMVQFNSCISTVILSHPI